MTHTQNWRLRSLFMLMLLCTFSIANAQSDPGPDPDTGIPIDGGVSLVIVAAVGYAAKKASKSAVRTKKKMKRMKRRLMSVPESLFPCTEIRTL